MSKRRDPLTPEDRESIARHRYGPHRCVGFFSEGSDCIVVRLAAALDSVLEDRQLGFGLYPDDQTHTRRTED